MWSVSPFVLYTFAYVLHASEIDNSTFSRKELIIDRVIKLRGNDTTVKLLQVKRHRNKTEIDLTHLRSKSLFYHFVLLRPDNYTELIGRRAEILLDTTRFITKRAAQGDDDSGLGDEPLSPVVIPPNGLSVPPPVQANPCIPQPLPCDGTARYRTFSGWCNNVQNPSFGMSHAPFRRLATPAYDDGFNEPRQKAQSGLPLSGPRVISLTVHSTVTRNNSQFTMMLMQWGQFFDHDIALTPMESSSGDSGPVLDCNDCNSRQTVSQNCFPIPIPDDDPVFGPSSGQCLPFVRSKAGQQHLGTRNQLNQFTSYIDLSMMYGSDDCRASQVRGNRRGGQLGAEVTRDGEVLPMPENENVGCRAQREHHCFFGADSRMNQHVGISSMHAVFVREHNQVADNLAKLNPAWDDEKLYQEARKISIALFQHITYNEFLPRVVGPEIMAEFDLNLRQTGFYGGYDPTCDATISNEFSTAAFRFGHSLVSSKFSVVDEQYRKVESFNLVDVFFNPGRLHLPRFCDHFIMGMMNDPIQAFDRFISPVLRNELFATPRAPQSGLDLASINIQRGRDHGLPSYTRFRQVFNLPVPDTFSDLAKWMDNGTVLALSKVYQSVHDIDLFTGLLSENPLPGAIVGPTAAKIIGEQFGRLRKCDRFWYENLNQAGSFNQGQLMEIRRQTAAHLLCRNLPSIRTIQPRVFDGVDTVKNSRMACNTLVGMDFSWWMVQTG